MWSHFGQSGKDSMGGGYTEVGMGSSEADKPLLLWVSGGQKAASQLWVCIPATAGWGAGVAIEVRVVVEAIPVCMDMYYVQRTRRELNKLKVFVSADTEAGAASSSALNSSPPWSQAPRSGMRISQLLTMPE